MTLEEKHYVNLKGKRFVLYEGLLAVAHERGIRSIDTELVQVPTEANGNLAIVKATVEMHASVELQNGDHEGRGPRFSGLGDASPESTSKQMVPHLLRLAETRSKARALRDALGVGTAAFEELGDDAGEDAPRASQSARPATNPKTYTAGGERQSSTGSGNSGERTPGGASKKATGKLRYLARKEPGGVEGWEAANGLIDDLSAAQVSQAITELEGEG